MIRVSNISSILNKNLYERFVNDEEDELKDKDIEILVYLIYNNNASNKYDIYKNTGLTLATAYRHINKLIKLGLIHYDEHSRLRITTKGIIILALLGCEEAISRLARTVDLDGYNEPLKIHMLKEFFSRIVEFNPRIIYAVMHASINDIKDVIPLLGDIKSIAKAFKDTLAEPLVAYLILNKYPKIGVDDSFNAVVDGNELIAVNCRACGNGKTRYSLLCNCPYFRLSVIILNR